MTTSTTPVSVASSSSAGAAGGSVIDVSSLVSQLVNATQAPQQKLITDQTTAVTADISALGTLKSALSTFQSSLTALATPGAFNSETANTSDQTVFTATANANAVGGSYAVTVSNLASAQQLLSGPVVGGATATVGTGTLTLTLGTTSFNVPVDTTNNTVSGIAAAINSASNNPGITATVITGTDGAHLVLSSTLTGAANTISVTESDGGTGLSALTYGPGNTGHYALNAKAADAVFSIAGVPYTSASNTVSNAISGVALTLVGTTTPPAPDGTGGTGATLTVANDTSTVEKNISTFVDAYNTLESSLASLGSFDSTTGTAGALLGNPVLSGIQNQINQTLHGLAGTSVYNSLASIGITSQADGTIAVNSSTLETALASNFTAVSQLFSSKTGIASQLNTQITTALASGNSLDSYAKTLTQQENALTQKSDDLTTQMTALTASLTHQYSVLDSLLSSLQTTSSYLTQAFATLPTVQSKASG
jgi:flagellar hook-associated protein 2